MQDSQLPRASHLLVDTRGAEILEGADDPDVYLPMHEEMISHIALDIGGSLAKVVYFTRPPKSTSAPSNACAPSSAHSPSTSTSNGCATPHQPNGVLGPKALSSSSTYPPFQNRIRRRSSISSSIPRGGRLNFTKFETTDLDSCITFLSDLITASAASNRVPLAIMKKSVKIMATGGGAHKFYERLRTELGVEVRREEEMECLVLGLGFVMEVPNEVFWYSDELIQTISHPEPFPRPSPNPPQYSLLFDESPKPAEFPCLLVNIGSGVSIIKIDDYGKFERISGTSLGGGTLWGLLSLLTGAKSFDDMLASADKGDNASVDMLVGDIYGSGYEKIGLKSSTIASSFGKVFKKETETGGAKRDFKTEDISKSLLYAISNNIGQIAYMNAEKYNLDRVYFAGGFIRGHAATISTLSYAIRFWSKGTIRAHFLRHEAYLGGMGAWLKVMLSDGADTPFRTPVELPVPVDGEPVLPPPPPIESPSNSLP